MPLQDSPEESDASARVCVWAERLEELGRPTEARRVLQEALERPGDLVRIRLTLARLQSRTGATAQATELLRKVLGDDPGNLPATRMLAEMLLDEGKADEAARVVADATSNGGESGDLAELAGEICRAQGRHAEAVAAFGPRASLSPRGRRLRRRSWWRSRGPLRRRSGQETVLTAAGTPARMPDPPDAMIEAITWVRWLNDVGRHDDARRVVSEAFAQHGRHPELLACAAGIEEAAGTVRTALYFWREAYRETPNDVDVVCGLAARLAYTLVSPSHTFRVADALRVLDGFPDQSHPKIRTMRADVLRANGASAARVVAAYGPAGGLSWIDARTRHRLLWRSAGPFGRLRVRIADRIRGERRRARAGAEAVPRTEAESEAIARLLDEVSGLPFSVARERIKDAERQFGSTPSLLLACAAVDASDGAHWHRLAMAAEAVRSAPDSLDAVCSLAAALGVVHGYGIGLQVLESLPAVARQTAEARVLASVMHRSVGNYALAVTAYGDPRDLDRYDLKIRRRCARRALLQRLSSTNRGEVDAVDPTSLDLVPPAIAQVLDREYSLAGEPARMRDLISAALEEHGRHPLLLLALAGIERQGGDRHAGAALAGEAMRGAPDDPIIVADGIRELWLADYDTDALRAIADLPEQQIRYSLPVSLIEGDIYRYWNLWGHLTTLFEAAEGGLEAWRWRMRRTGYWRSGGPIARIRTAVLNQEDNLLSGWVLPERREAALSSLPLPAPTKDAVRNDLADYRMTGMYRTEFWPGALLAWLGELFLPASVVIVFAALTLAERLHWPSATISHCLTAAALATAVDAVALWILNKIDRSRVTWISIAMAGGAGVTILVHFTGQMAYGAGLTLTALAVVAVAAYVQLQALRLARGVRIARWQRREAETRVLSSLLDLLGELATPQQRRAAAARRTWMAGLERVAVIIERDLPHALRSGDPDSQSTIAAHARSAATALREMKQTIALPDEEAWQELIERLTGLATALASHDFKNWPPPLPEVTAPQPMRPLWRKVLDAGRAVLVIFTPPLVAYLLPLAVPLSGPGLSWLRLATIVWALLGTLIALDPAWTDRVAKMRQGLDLLRQATPPKDTDGNAMRNTPDDAAEQITGNPRRPVARHAPARHGTATGARRGTDR